MQVFDDSGGFLFELAGSGDPNQVINPFGIAVAGLKVHVTDTGNDQMSVFTCDLALLTVPAVGGRGLIA